MRMFTERISFEVGGYNPSLIKEQMNEDIEHFERIGKGLGMDVETFLVAVDRDGIFAREGVDTRALDDYICDGNPRIPVLINGHRYDIDPQNERLETRDGSISMSGGSAFGEVARKIEQGLYEKLDAENHREQILQAMEVAGYSLNKVDSDSRLVFDGEGTRLRFDNLVQVKEWLNAVVFDDPAVSDKVESLINGDTKRHSKPAGIGIER